MRKDHPDDCGAAVVNIGDTVTDLAIANSEGDGTPNRPWLRFFRARPFLAWGRNAVVATASVRLGWLAAREAMAYEVHLREGRVWSARPGRSPRR